MRECRSMNCLLYLIKDSYDKRCMETTYFLMKTNRKKLFNYQENILLKVKEFLIFQI